jgi:heme/copper-type cytochrome/quinol oxidase subunit 2
MYFTNLMIMIIVNVLFFMILMIIHFNDNENNQHFNLENNKSLNFITVNILCI